MDKKIAVIDTNILLHYALPSDIDWCTLLEAKEVEVVITRKVMSELNRHKDSRAQKRESKRAAVVIRYIAKTLNGQLTCKIRSGVSLTLDVLQPDIAFADHHLDKDVADDWVLASAIALRDKRDDAKVVVIANDYAVASSANGLGLTGIWWDDNEYRLPEELDPDQKRIRELEQSIRELQNRMPVIDLQFNNAKRSCEFVLGGLTAAEIEAELDSIWNKHSLGRKRLGLGLVGLKNADQYDWSVRRYCAEYKEYLQAISNYKAHVLRLDLVAANTGTSVADDVRIELAFPEHLDVRDDYDLPEKPKPPRPPKPGEDLATGLALARWDSSWLAKVYQTPKGGSNVGGPNLLASNKVAYRIVRAMHHNPVELPPIYVVYDDSVEPSPFRIDYCLSSKDLPGRVVGHLNVIVNR